MQRTFSVSIHRFLHTISIRIFKYNYISIIHEHKCIPPCDTPSEFAFACHRNSFYITKIKDTLAMSSGKKMEEMNVLVEDVHIRAAQMDEVLSQVRDNCESYITSAKKEASDIVTEAEKQAEAIKAAAMKEAGDMKAEAEKIMQDAHKETEEMKLEIVKWEEEKAAVTSTQIFEPKVKLDVGGNLFTTTSATLTRFPDTMIGAIFSGRHALIKDEAGVYFIDRDGRHFHYILNFLRSPETFDRSVLKWSTILAAELKNEAEYYGLKDLMFPPPPFVPTEPEPVNTITTGTSVIVSQCADQLWYATRTTRPIIGPAIIHICDNCGFGCPEGWHHSWGIAKFTTGRTIHPAQPKQIGICMQCRK